MPDVSPNLELINRAENLIRDGYDANGNDLSSEAHDIIERLLVALMGRETQVALLHALVKEGVTDKPVAQNGTEYRVTYPTSRTAAEPVSTRVFSSGEQMLDLALYCKQSAPEFADHVVMETREVFVGPWRKL